MLILVGGATHSGISLDLGNGKDTTWIVSGMIEGKTLSLQSAAQEKEPHQGA